MPLLAACEGAGPLGLGRLLEAEPAPRPAGVAGIADPGQEPEGYPRLATVPPPPPSTTNLRRQGDAEALATDRARAQAIDQALRGGAPPPTQAPSRPPTPALAPAAPGQAPAGADVSLKLAELSFARGSGTLSDADRRRLRETAGVILARDGRVRVVARTDDGGVRAQAVAGELVRNGVPAARISLRTEGARDQGVEIYLDY